MTEMLPDARLHRRFLAVYLTGLAVPFLCRLLMLLGLSVAAAAEQAFRPLLVCLLGIAVTGLHLTGRRQSAKLRLDGVLLLLTYLWIIVVFLLHRHTLDRAEFVLSRAAIAWMGFYAFGFLLTADEAKRGLRLLAAVWGGGMTLLALLGLYAAISRIGIRDLNDNLTYGMVGGRMTLGIYTTSTSENLLTAELLVAAAALADRRKRVLIPAVLAEIILFTAMALTDGRNGILSTGIFVGLLCFILLLGRFPGKRATAFFTAAAAAIGCIALVYFGAQLVQQPFPGSYDRELSLRSVILEPILHENADAPEVPETPADPAAEDIQMQAVSFRPIRNEAKFIRPAAHRKIEGSLNGRTDIWRCGTDLILHSSAHIWLIGATPFADLSELNQQYCGQPFNCGLPYTVDHMHNIFLQVLLEWGLPGAALLLALLVLFAIAAGRLLRLPGLPLWQRLLPAPAIVLLLADMVDAFTMFTTDNAALYVLFLFLGLSIRFSREA